MVNVKLIATFRTCEEVFIFHSYAELIKKFSSAHVELSKKFSFVLLFQVQSLVCDWELPRVLSKVTHPFCRVKTRSSPLSMAGNSREF